MNKEKGRIPHIKITVEENTCCTHVFIDEKEIPDVRRVRFDQTPGKFPILQLDIMACDMEISGCFLPALPEIFKDFYIRGYENEDGTITVARNNGNDITIGVSD